MKGQQSELRMSAEICSRVRRIAACNCGRCDVGLRSWLTSINPARWPAWHWLVYLAGRAGPGGADAGAGDGLGGRLHLDGAEGLGADPGPPGADAAWAAASAGCNRRPTA